MARPVRRSKLPVGLVVLALVGVAIGALISLAQRGDPDAGQAQELAALKESSERRAASGGDKAADEPRLCGELRRAPVGTVKDTSLEELSGLVQSRRDGKLLWGIEDSGNPAQLSAIRPNGTVVGRWNVAGAENFDWEDVATGPGAPGGAAWLYAADIGDNLRQREHVTIYRVPEPAAPSGGGTTAPAQALQLRYPDGAHDAESFLVDPKRGTLVLVTKGVPGAVYAASRPASWSGTVKLRKIHGAGIAYATAADVSADSRTVALRGYFNVALWQRKGNEPLTATLRRTPCTSPTGLDDGQGEAIALASNGRSAWIVAEGNTPPIRRLTPR
ncbi:MAG: hypothetical protein J7513_03380 [Solirubrobacteraceae bacterium]|nr:hypothetical protein [Solirubrobacteraceae bacterium]